MGRMTASARHSWRGVAVVALAALLLASCGTPKVAKSYVTGTPSFSIEIPLTSAACTTSSSCIAVGGDDASSGPSATAQVREKNGTWTAIDVPDATSVTLSSSACWSADCLIGGSQPTGDALWLYDARAGTMTVSPVPPGGKGVSEIDCFALESCALVDATTITASLRLSFTTDGGATWSTPQPLNWSVGDAVTSLSCADALDCLVGAETSSRSALLEVTHDAGVTWASRDVDPTWQILSSLDCVATHCIALVATASDSLIVRTNTFGRVWTTLTLKDSATGLACARLSRCVVVGQDTSGDPWLATLQGHKVDNVALKYVPTALVTAACGVKVCVAIGPSTVLSTSP